jgi:uncharacterized protein involved in exopolysaccharide biosynthesis
VGGPQAPSGSELRGVQESDIRPPESPRPSDEVDLRALGRNLLRRWPLPVGLAIAGATISLIITFLTRPVYQARAALYLPVANQSVRLPGVVNAAPSDPVSILAGILSSRTAQEEMRKKMELEPKDVSKHLAIEPLPYSSQVVLKFDWNTPDGAKAALEELIAGLRKIDAEVGISLITGRLRATENELEEVQERLDKAERDLSEFLAKAKTNPSGTSLVEGSVAQAQLRDLEVQLAAVNREIGARRQLGSQAMSGQVTIPRGVPSIDALQARLAEAQIKLNNARAVFRPNTPEVRHAQDEVEAVRAELAKEINAHNQSIRANVNPTLVDLQTKKAVLERQILLVRDQAELAPREALEAQRLTRAMQIEEQSYRDLQQQIFELSLQEQANEVKWTVLDPPEAASKPVNKRYTVNALLFGVLGGMLGLLWASRSK